MTVLESSMTLSVRARLTAWYALLLAGVVLALGTFLVVQLDDGLQQAVDEEVVSSSGTILRDLVPSSEDDDEPAAEEFEDAARTVLPDGHGAVQLLDGQGLVLASYGPLADGPPLVPGDLQAAALAAPVGPRTVRLGDEGERYRVRVAAFPPAGERAVLVVAVPLEPVEAASGRVLRLLLVAGPSAVLVTGAAAFCLASRTLRPLRRMASDAERITTARLSDRVAQPAASDEVGRLATTLNAMLDRIERGVLDKRRLIADASHELRTPLAVMRAEMDVSLRTDDLPPPAREVLRSAVDEVDRMSRTVDNLLTLAQVEEDRLDLGTDRVDLPAVVEQAVRPLRSLAAAKGLALQVSGEPCAVDADPRRLQLAVANLVENAVKFTPPGGSIRYGAGTAATRSA